MKENRKNNYQKPVVYSWLFGSLAQRRFLIFQWACASCSKFFVWFDLFAMGPFQIFFGAKFKKKILYKTYFFTLKKRNRPQWYHFNIIFTDSRTLKDAKAQNNKRFWQSNFDQYHEQKQSKNDEKDTYQGVNNDWILIGKSFIKIMILTDGCQLHCTKFF